MPVLGLLVAVFEFPGGAWLMAPLAIVWFGPVLAWSALTGPDEG